MTSSGFPVPPLRHFRCVGPNQRTLPAWGERGLEELFTVTIDIFDFIVEIVIDYTPSSTFSSVPSQFAYSLLMESSYFSSVIVIIAIGIIISHFICGLTWFSKTRIH